MSTIIRRVGRFIRSEDGPTAVEYAVMVALIAVAIITAVSQLGTQLNTTFGNVKTTLSTKVSGT